MRITTNALNEHCLVIARLAVIASLAIFAWVCVQSATERPGWPWPEGRWGPTSARTKAAKMILHGDSLRAIAQAKIALNQNPMDRGSASILAAALWRSGRTEHASSAFQLETRNSWRDNAAQVWAVEAELANKQLARAAQHLDALLRVTPQAEVPPAWMTAIEGDQIGRTALASRLSHSPRWSQRWLRSSSELAGKELQRRIQTLETARTMGFAPADDGAVTATRQMLRTHSERALQFWHALMGPGESFSRGVWDADFKRSDLSKSKSPFSWHRAASSDVMIATQEKEGVAGLSVTSPSENPEPLVETIIALKPGRYQITWSQSSPGLSFHFNLTCSRSGQKIGQHAFSIDGESKGTKFVTPDNCPLQVLTLISDGAAPHSIDGFIYNLTIRPDTFRSTPNSTRE